MNADFNIDTSEPKITGECSFDTIVDRYDTKQLIILIQCIKRVRKWNIVIGIASMGADGTV
jgi:hypothetical protein